MASLEILQFAYNADNYGVLLHCLDSGDTACIDAGDASATEAALAQTGWSLTHLIITHHHDDHTAGLKALKAAHNAHVIGPHPRSVPIYGIDSAVWDGDSFAEDSFTALLPRLAEKGLRLVALLQSQSKSRFEQSWGSAKCASSITPFVDEGAGDFVGLGARALARTKHTDVLCLGGGKTTANEFAAESPSHRARWTCYNVPRMVQGSESAEIGALAEL